MASTGKSRNIVIRCIITILIGILFICLFNSIMLHSANALYFCGHLAAWIAYFLLLIAIIMRLAKSSVHLQTLEGRLYRLFINPQNKVFTPGALVVLCIASATLYQLPLLGAHAGVQWDWPYEFADHSAIAGVLPFADAKQHYGAAVGMPVLDTMGGHLVARRPTHAANLASWFVLTGFNSFAVLAVQAALCGITLLLACVYLSRIAGPPIAVAVWALVYRFSEGAIPTFMSATTGTWLGLIAFILVFSSILHRRHALMAIALGIFILAFSARAGAYFILPALFVCGLWYVRKDHKEIMRFLAITLIATILSASIPFALNKIYDSRGGEYQGNLVYVLYMLSVGSNNWQQIIIDYPDSRKEIKPASRWLRFALSKTKDAFFANPFLFFKATSVGLLKAAEEMPESYMLNIIQPSDYNKYVEESPYIKPLFLVIFYGGLLYLLFSRALSIQLRISFFLVILGYAISLPFIWLTEAIRFQAVTYMIPAVIIAGPLARRGNYISPLPSKLPAFTGYTAYIWIICSLFIPKLYHPDFPFNLDDLKSITLPQKQRIGYILAGPYMSYIRLLDDNRIHARPYISYNKFKNLRPIKRDRANKNILAPYRTGEQLTIAWDVTQKVHRMYWSKPFCVPDRLWIYQAIIVPQSPPYVFRLKDIKPLGENGEPEKPGGKLPYKCL